MKKSSLGSKFLKYSGFLLHFDLVFVTDEKEMSKKNRANK